MSLSAILVMLVAASAAPAPLSVQRMAGALAVTASVAKATYAPGEPVVVQITIRNVSPDPLSLTFNSGQRFELTVRRPRGDEVWRWSHDKAFIQVVQTITLRPQEVRAFPPGIWDQRDFQGRMVDPGPYEVVVHFLGRVGDRGGVALPPLPITIIAR
ncbi:MAG TPA: BsuPI-related putative proteinase inhibitor [bacterium]|nr:BsuPI-related putative proteinase inhibitor [bacterium]